METFRPHPLLKCPHRQTLFGLYLPGPKFEYQATPQNVNCDCGDTLIMHDDEPEEWTPGDRCALLIHGLVGCHGSPYMKRVALRLISRGVRVFRLDLRGHGASSHAKSIGHAGRSDDAFAAVRTINALAPDSPISMVGFSMGANIALKSAAESGMATHETLNSVDQVIAVSPPANLRVCVEHMSHGINRWYDRSFAKQLAKLVKQRKACHANVDHLELQPRAGSIFEFDQRFTAPLGGFRDAHDYYEQCSALRVIDHLCIPTWVIAAKDDPLIPFSIFEGLDQHPFIETTFTDHGGHLGFIGEKNHDPDRRWLDWRIVERIHAP